MNLKRHDDPIVFEGNEVAIPVAHDAVLWNHYGIETAKSPRWLMDDDVAELLDLKGYERAYVAYAVTDSDAIPLFEIDVGGMIESGSIRRYGKQQYEINSGDDFVTYVGIANDHLSYELNFEHTKYDSYHKQRNEA